MRGFSVFLIFATFAVCRADVITSAACSVTPQVGTPAVNDGVDSCSASLPGPAPALPQGSAQGTISGYISTDGASFTGNTQADVFANIVGNNTPSAQVTVQGTESLLLYTLGPIRQGTLIYTLEPQLGTADAPNVNGSVSIGSLSAGCSYGPSCAGSLVVGTFVSVPFTLGESFELSETFSASSYADLLDQEDGSGNVAINFFLLDANGDQVPVYVAAPEPPSGLLAVGAGMGLVVFARRNMRRASEKTSIG